MANVAGEGFIQTARFRFQPPNFNVDTRGSQLLKASPAHLRIGVGHGCNHAANSGGDQSVRARRCAALVGVRFEIDVERASAGLAARLL